MTRRLEQISKTLRRAIQTQLDRGLSDPRVKGSISVTEVKVAPDLRTAKVFVSIMPEEHESLTMHGLVSATRHIRRRVGDNVAMARVPDLTFELDRSLKTQRQVLEAIAQAKAELDEAGESGERRGGWGSGDKHQEESERTDR